MISTVEDLLAYGRALGTGEGLFSPEQQAERLDSFIRDLPPFNQPPLNGDAGYGIGLTYDRGWIGHGGEIDGYNTQLFYHPELDAVVAVAVNSDISSGDCPVDRKSRRPWRMTDDEVTLTCARPETDLQRARRGALRKY
jgi:D-alanyl-D-alanine carboxypeptidase